MKDAFIFLTRQPEKLQKLLLKFYEGTQNAQQEFDFHICSYEEDAEQSVSQIELNGHVFQHWVFGRTSAFSLGYGEKVNEKNWVLIPGNCDVPVLAFFRANNNYQRYWLVEDDVDYSGDVKTLIDDVSAHQADLQCSHLQQCWDLWTNNKMLKAISDKKIEFSETFVCFLPFFSITNEGLSLIDQAYRDGWAGHHEQIWPTILLRAGLKVRDIGGSGEFVAKEDINLHYFGLAPGGLNKVGSFIPTPPRLFMGSKPNTLWHPVKPFDQWISGKIRRLRSIFSYYLGQVKS